MISCGLKCVDSFFEEADFKVLTGNAPADKLCPSRFILDTIQLFALCYLIRQLYDPSPKSPSNKNDCDKAEDQLLCL